MAGFELKSDFEKVCVIDRIRTRVRSVTKHERYPLHYGHCEFSREKWIVFVFQLCLILVVFCGGLKRIFRNKIRLIKSIEIFPKFFDPKKFFRPQKIHFLLFDGDHFLFLWHFDISYSFSSRALSFLSQRKTKLDRFWAIASVACRRQA